MEQEGLDTATTFGRLAASPGPSDRALLMRVAAHQPPTGRSAQVTSALRISRSGEAPGTVWLGDISDSRNTRPAVTIPGRWAGMIVACASGSDHRPSGRSEERRVGKE